MLLVETMTTDSDSGVWFVSWSCLLDLSCVSKR